jgi:hypothetical protein
MRYENRLISPTYEANFTLFTSNGLEYDHYMCYNHAHEKKELKNTSVFSMKTGIVGGSFGQPHFRKAEGKP